MYENELRDILTANGADLVGFSNVSDELPEELEEDPDDALLDEQDKEKERRFDKVFNVFAAVIFSLLGGFLIYKLLDMFLF